MPRSFYVNKETGALARIVKMDDSFVHLEVVHPKYSTYQMPIQQYDSVFANQWIPASAEDFDAIQTEVRPPANAPDPWVR